MKIIGRKSEKKELERCNRSEKSELVCVYGRRRVGKTYLVEQTFAGSFAFRATGVEKGNTRQQLKSFHQRLKDHGDESKAAPKDWFEAFSRLEKVLKREDIIRSSYNKKIVFLDEFPWFATPRSDFLMAFGEFWNRCGTAEGNYLFIICGSATSWIINNILDATGSLYHRVTCQIFLAPFDLHETEQFFADREFGWTRKQIMECRMIFGGLPFFMDLLNKDESLRQNIDRLIFRKNALLHNETNRLLEATLKKSPVYGCVLDELSRHKYGIRKSECRELLNISEGTFNRAVGDMVRCGYIAEYKRHYEAYNPIYLQLSDNFLLFHYSFISGNDGIRNYGELLEQEGLYANWRGHAFELLCIQHIDMIKKALGISGVHTNSFPWVSTERKGGAQIDLVIERDDHITNLCEMKCTDKPFAVSREYDARLINKKDVFKRETGTNQALRLILISAEGLEGTANTENISDVITMDDLFE